VLQSCQFHKAPKDLSKLIVQTKETFNNYPPVQLGDVWLTLQTCMNSIIENDGSNEYKLAHMSKYKIEREGLLLQSIFPVEVHPVFHHHGDGEEEANGDDDGMDLDGVSAKFT